MLNRDFQNYLLVLVLVLAIAPLLIVAQDALVYSTDSNNKFEELIADPEKFTPYERVDIYLQEVSKLLAVNVDSAYAEYRKMEEYGHKLGDSLLIGIAISTSATVQSMKGDYKSALIGKKKSLNYIKSHPKRQGEVYGAIGEAYLALNQLDSAEFYLTKNEKITFSLKDSVEFSNIFIRKAQLHKGQNRYSSAIESYQEALKYIHLSHSRLKEIDCYIQISSIYRKFNDIENSNFYLDKGLEVAKKQGYKTSIHKISLNIGRNSMLEGRFKEAYDIFAETLLLL